MIKWYLNFKLMLKLENWKKCKCNWDIDIEREGRRRRGEVRRRKRRWKNELFVLEFEWWKLMVLKKWDREKMKYWVGVGCCFVFSYIYIYIF